MPICVHEHDRDRRNAVRVCRSERGAHFGEIGNALHGAIGAHALVDLDHTLVEHVGLDDVARKNVRPGLIADPQRIAEPARDYEQCAFALALKQRIGGDRGSHLDRADEARRDRRSLRQA